MDEYISKQRAKNLMGCCLASAKAEYKAAKDEFTKARFGDYISAIQSMIDVIDKVEATDVQPVKHGRWLNHHAIWINQSKIEGWFVQAKCSKCEKWAHVMNPYTKSVDYECCPHCGVKMDLDGVTPNRCSNYMDCDGSCFIDDTPCECGGNIEKCKGRWRK